LIVRFVKNVNVSLKYELGREVNKACKYDSTHLLAQNHPLLFPDGLQENFALKLYPALLHPFPVSLKLGFLEAWRIRGYEGVILGASHVFCHLTRACCVGRTAGLQCDAILKSGIAMRAPKIAKAARFPCNNGCCCPQQYRWEGSLLVEEAVAEAG
jgi:hypothetical protein